MKSIKDRDFYICVRQNTFSSGSSVVGLWDNPSVCFRDVKQLIKQEFPDCLIEMETVADINVFYIRSNNSDSYKSLFFKVLKTKIYDSKMQTG